VDEIKRRLPVWKRQVFADGTDEWVDCPQGVSRLYDEVPLTGTIGTELRSYSRTSYRLTKVTPASR
jgi:hypothetical protein